MLEPDLQPKPLDVWSRSYSASVPDLQPYLRLLQSRIRKMHLLRQTYFCALTLAKFSEFCPCLSLCEFRT